MSSRAGIFCCRATVIVLAINLDYRIDLRQGLIDEGVFPPQY
jgi:hypothetical protein